MSNTTNPSLSAGAAGSPAAEPLTAVEWQFPLGGCTARLSIVASEGHRIEPEDMDALREIAELMKRQLIRRQTDIEYNAGGAVDEPGNSDLSREGGK